MTRKEIQESAGIITNSLHQGMKIDEIKNYFLELGKTEKEWAQVNDYINEKKYIKKQREKEKKMNNRNKLPYKIIFTIGGFIIMAMTILVSTAVFLSLLPLASQNIAVAMIIAAGLIMGIIISWVMIIVAAPQIELWKLSLFQTFNIITTPFPTAQLVFYIFFTLVIFRISVFRAVLIGAINTAYSLSFIITIKHYFG